MSASRPVVLVLTGLMALLLTGRTPQKSNYVELSKSRLIIVKIPAGTFRVGSDQLIHADGAWDPCFTCSPRDEVERPVHQVTISKDFWMGQFDVTQKQWQDVMGNNPSGNRQAVLMPQLSRSVGRMSSPSWQEPTPCKALGRFACRRKRSGNMRPELAALAKPMGPFRRSLGIRPTAAVRPIPWARKDRMPSVFMTCWETSGSGAKTGLARTRAMA